MGSYGSLLGTAVGRNLWFRPAVSPRGQDWIEPGPGPPGRAYPARPSSCRVSVSGRPERPAGGPAVPGSNICYGCRRRCPAAAGRQDWREGDHRPTDCPSPAAGPGMVEAIDHRLPIARPSQPPSAAGMRSWRRPSRPPIGGGPNGPGAGGRLAADYEVSSFSWTPTGAASPRDAAITSLITRFRQGMSQTPYSEPHGPVLGAATRSGQVHASPDVVPWCTWVPGVPWYPGYPCTTMQHIR